MKTLELIPEDLKIYAQIKPWHVNALIKADSMHLCALLLQLVLRYGGFSRNGGITKSIRTMASECGYASTNKFHVNLQKLRELGIISYGNRKSSMQAGTILFINVDQPHEHDADLPTIERAAKPAQKVDPKPTPAAPIPEPQRASEPVYRPVATPPVPKQDRESREALRNEMYRRREAERQRRLAGPTPEEIRAREEEQQRKLDEEFAEMALAF